MDLHIMTVHCCNTKEQPKYEYTEKFILVCGMNQPMTTDMYSQCVM